MKRVALIRGVAVDADSVEGSGGDQQHAVLPGNVMVSFHQILQFAADNIINLKKTVAVQVVPQTALSGNSMAVKLQGGSHLFLFVHDNSSHSLLPVEPQRFFCRKFEEAFQILLFAV